MSARRFAFALVLAASAAACATGPQLSATCAGGQPGPITGEWVLAALDGAPLMARRDVTLLAQDEGFAGAMSCNSYGTTGPAAGGAHYAVTDGRLVLADAIVMTMASCSPLELMQADQAFLDILSDSPRVARQEASLCLYTDDGRSLEFRRQVAAGPT